jgi:predicted negative regulator of RcsB-dependent stress response
MNIVLVLIIAAHVYVGWLAYQAYKITSVRRGRRRRR